MLAIEVNRVKLKVNKPIYLSLTILEFCKTVMYELYYDYINRKYQGKANLCYINTVSFIVNIKTENIYKDIESDVEKRFDTSKYEIKRLLPIGKKK